MNSRPTAIVVIACILIILGIMGVLRSIAEWFVSPRELNELAVQNALFDTLFHAMFLVGDFVLVVCGCSMLSGRNWSRYLYVSWTRDFDLPLKWAAVNSIVLLKKCVDHSKSV